MTHFLLSGVSCYYVLLCSHFHVLYVKEDKKDRLDNKRMLKKKRPVVLTRHSTILCGLITTGLRYRILFKANICS